MKFLNKNYALFSILMVIAIAFFRTAKTTMLADTSMIPMEAVYVSRFSGIITYAFIAILLRNRVPSINYFFYTAVPFAFLYLAVSILEPVFRPHLGTVLLYSMSVLHGVTIALLMLLCVYALSHLPIKHGAIIIASAEILGNLLSSSVASLGLWSLYITRNVFLLISVLIFFKFARKLSYVYESAPAAPSSGSTSAQEVLSSGIAKMTSAEKVSLLSLLIAALVFNSVFGIVAQTMSPLESNFGLYDIGTSIIVILSDLFLLVFVCFAGDKFKFTTMFALVGIIFLVGLALLPGSITADFSIAGALVRTGFSFCTVLSWILIARKAYEHPTRCLFYFSMYYAFNSVYYGRALGSVIAGTGVPKIELLSDAVLGSMLFIGVAAIVLALLISKKLIIPDFYDMRSLTSQDESVLRRFFEKDAAAHASSQTSVGENALTELSPESRIELFSKKYRLSERERAVLAEAVKGYDRTRIAERLFISPETVKSYLSHIYLKVGIKSKQELISVVESETFTEN